MAKLEFDVGAEVVLTKSMTREHPVYKLNTKVKIVSVDRGDPDLPYRVLKPGLGEYDYIWVRPSDIRAVLTANTTAAIDYLKSRLVDLVATDEREDTQRILVEALKLLGVEATVVKPVKASVTFK